MRPEIPRIGATDGHRLTARRLLRAARAATLATTTGSESATQGAPYASLITVATDHDGSPLLLLSELADHTRNLNADPACCLLVDDARHLANPQTGPRVSFQCSARRIADPAEHQRLTERFLRHHPAAALYAGFGDFAIRRLTITRAHLVGGFARAVWLEDGLTIPAALAQDMAAAEVDVVTEMNARHADAIQAIARELPAAGGDFWQLSSLDADGMDLCAADGETVHRIPFTPPLDSAEQVHPRLMALATQAPNDAAPAKYR